jgi:hypothetical protein
MLRLVAIEEHVNQLNAKDYMGWQPQAVLARLARASRSGSPTWTRPGSPYRSSRRPCQHRGRTVPALLMSRLSDAGLDPNRFCGFQRKGAMT